MAKKAQDAVVDALSARFPIVRKFRDQPHPTNCIATCIHNALVALGDKTQRQDIQRISIKEINRTIRLKKQMIPNPPFIVPAFNNHFEKKRLRAHEGKGPRIDITDLERVLGNPVASPLIVTVSPHFFEVYGVEVPPPLIVAGDEYEVDHDILILAIDDKIWFHDPLANIPPLSRAKAKPQGRMDLQRFLEVWKAKETNSFMWIESVLRGPIDKWTQEE